MDISIDLTTAWAVLLAFATFVYVVLDGFDLGIGILYPVFPKKSDRDLMMNSVAPVWDGNETWLILGGGGLLAAFPMAYAILLPAVYMPVIVMLLALVFRGVAFEFRWRSKRAFAARAWDASFIGGSVVAAMMQGIILGTLLQGIEVDGRAYGGGWWDWLTPFTVICGFGVVAGYALMGACWLNWKLEGPTQQRVKAVARMAGIAALGFILLVSALTPSLDAAYWTRWFSFPQILFAAPVPVLTALLAWGLARSLTREGRDWLPMLLVVALFFMCFTGLGISMWPYIIPTEVTIWEAASPYKSQLFMFVGAIVLVPIILAYTAFAYWVFRGKLDPEEGYH